ncbi:hypothetical protein [Candidatus Phytoplasma pruni]|uniref:Antigenic membrane protein n=1 Tax=Candidatus Phytoplasma pruni TaxID=479893 RepID=A0A851HI12_9MOLU|nr:hypothetical protein [Candidatus Phytoplasma pruni]NWN45944.1 hypothetical protein [Candidatus Phytoplasma pruni]
MASLLLVLVGNSYKVFADPQPVNLDSVLTVKDLGPVECDDTENPKPAEVLAAVVAKNANVKSAEVTVTVDTTNKKTNATVAVNSGSQVYNTGSVNVTYTTKVKTADKNSNPWYKSVWFWLLVLVVVGGASYGTYYVVSKNKKTKNKK